MAWPRSVDQDPFHTLSRRNWTSQRFLELKHDVFKGATAALAALLTDALDIGLQAKKPAWNGMSRLVEMRPETSQALEYHRGLVAAFFSRAVSDKFDVACRAKVSLDNVPNTEFEEKRITFIDAASTELDFKTAGPLASMRQSLLVASAFGAGLGIVAILGVAIMSYWAGRPTPWNRDAVSAVFDSADTEGNEHKLLFVYILSNNSDRDFRVDTAAELRVTGRLQRQAALTPENSKDILGADLPLFIPRKQRARLVIHLGYAYGGPSVLSRGTSKVDRDANEKAITAFLRDELSNLDGFVLFHEPSHYEIDLPAGWKN